MLCDERYHFLVLFAFLGEDLTVFFGEDLLFDLDLVGEDFDLDFGLETAFFDAPP